MTAMLRMRTMGIMMLLPLLRLLLLAGTTTAVLDKGGLQPAGASSRNSLQVCYQRIKFDLYQELILYDATRKALLWETPSAAVRDLCRCLSASQMASLYGKDPKNVPFVYNTGDRERCVSFFRLQRAPANTFCTTTCDIDEDKTPGQYIQCMVATAYRGFPFRDRATTKTGFLGGKQLITCLQDHQRQHVGRRLQPWRPELTREVVPRKPAATTTAASTNPPDAQMLAADVAKKVGLLVAAIDTVKAEEKLVEELAQDAVAEAEALRDSPLEDDPPITTDDPKNTSTKGGFEDDGNPVGADMTRAGFSGGGDDDDEEGAGPTPARFSDDGDEEEVGRGGGPTQARFVDEDSNEDEGGDVGPTIYRFADSEDDGNHD